MNQIAQQPGHFGKIDLVMELAEDMIVLDFLFDNFKIIEVDRTSKIFKDIIVLVCESEKFDKLEPGDIIPEYQVQITQTEKSTFVLDKVTRQK